MSKIWLGTVVEDLSPDFKTVTVPTLYKEGVITNVKSNVDANVGQRVFVADFGGIHQHVWWIIGFADRQPASGGGGGVEGPIDISDVEGLQAEFDEIASALAGKSDTGHVHTQAQITGLIDALAGKAAAAHTHTYESLTGKPNSFPPESHTHDFTTGVTGKPATYPPSTHQHAITDVNGLPQALAEAGGGLDAVRTAFATAMRNRNSTPVKIVAAGSSTMNGGVVTTYDRRLAERLSAYTTKNPCIYDLTVTNVTDVQWYEIANGGTQSSNYLTSAQIPQLGTLKPQFMLHCVGSNDYAAQVEPATYKARLKSWLDQIIAVSPNTKHVYIAQQPRNDGAAVRTYNWWQYTVILKEIASEYPGVVAVADFSDEFEKVGLPGSDVWGLVATDNMHFADWGNKVFAQLIIQWLGVPLPPEHTQRFHTTSVMVASGDHTGPKDILEIVIPPAAYPRTGQITASVYYAARYQPANPSATIPYNIEFAVYQSPEQDATPAKVERNFVRGNSWAQTAPGSSNSGQTANVIAQVHVPPHLEARYYVRYNSSGITYISGASSYTRAYVEVDPA